MSDRKKEYMKVYNKEYRLKNKEKIKELNENRKEYMKAYNKEYRLNNKEKLKEKRNKKNKKYSLENKEIIKNYQKKWYLENKEKRNLYMIEYVKNRKKNDPLFKLRHNIRHNITTLIKKRGYTKKSKTYQILGCSFEDFKKHIEKQFTDGMNWENQGKWHFDHIYPVSLAKDEEELIKLNHYTNFQPLWAIDNLRKSNKIIDATT